MLTLLGIAAGAVGVATVLAALGKVDVDKEFAAFGYTIEIQLNENVPLGIMIAKDS